MVKLNLPQFDYSIKKDEGKIFILDIIRKRYLVLTPEEWVRQHFIHYLITDLKYPKALIKVEGGLRFNRLQKRTDIVVYNRDGIPWMIVECKSPEHKLTQHTLRQASVYNHTLQAKYITISNGLQHFCCAVNWEEQSTSLVDGMPPFE